MRLILHLYITKTNEGLVYSNVNKREQTQTEIHMIFTESENLHIFN